MPSLQNLTDPEGLLDLVPPGQAVSLSDPDVVEGLLRGYAAFLLRAVDVPDPAQEQEGLVAAFREEANRLQAIFFGQDPAYHGTAWNTPQQLGRYLSTSPEVALGCAYEVAVARLLQGFWLELAPNVWAYRDETLSEDMMKVAVEELVARYHYFLRGVPLPADYASVA